MHLFTGPYTYYTMKLSSLFRKDGDSESMHVSFFPIFIFSGWARRFGINGCGDFDILRRKRQLKPWLIFTHTHAHTISTLTPTHSTGQSFYMHQTSWQSRMNLGFAFVLRLMRKGWAVCDWVRGARGKHDEKGRGLNERNWHRVSGERYRLLGHHHPEGDSAQELVTFVIVQQVRALDLTLDGELSIVVFLSQHQFHSYNWLDVVWLQRDKRERRNGKKWQIKDIRVPIL